MSDVSNVDGGYRYYHAQVNEMEDDMRQEANKKEEEHEKEIERLKRAYVLDLRGQEQEHKENIKDIKESVNNELTKERSLSKNEIDNQKRTSESIQRDKDDLIGHLNKKINNAYQEREDQYRFDKTILKEVEDANHKKLQRVHEEYTNELKNAVEDTRDSALRTLSDLNEAEKKEYDEMKKNLQNYYGKLVKESNLELNGERDHYQSALRGIVSQKNDNEGKLENYYNHLFNELKQKSQIDKEHIARDLTNNHSKETNLLRDQLNILEEHKKQFPKGMAEGRSEAIKENETKNIIRKDLQQKSHSGEVKKLKHDHKISSEYQSELNNRKSRDKENQHSRIIENYQSESHRKYNDAVNDYKEIVEDKDLKLENSKKENIKNIDKQVEIAKKESLKTLKNQSENYQNQIDDGKKLYLNEIGEVNKKIKSLDKTKDISDISPALEERLTQQIKSYYNNVLSENRDKTDRQVEKVIDDYLERIRENKGEYKEKEVRLTTELTGKIDYQRAKFLNHMDDVKEDNSLKLSQKEEDLGDQFDLQNKRLSSEVTALMQKNALREIGIRERAMSALSESEAAFRGENRLAIKKLKSMHHDTVRQYERKLSELKQFYEDKMHLLKEDTQSSLMSSKKIHENDLKNKEELYSKRIENLKDQNKQREENIRENYEDQMNKVKLYARQSLSGRG